MLFGNEATAYELYTWAYAQIEAGASTARLSTFNDFYGTV